MLSNMIQYHVCIADPGKRYNRSPTEMLSEVLDLTGTGSRQISTSDNSSTGHLPPETFFFGPGSFYSHPTSTLPVPTLPQKLLNFQKVQAPEHYTLKPISSAAAHHHAGRGAASLSQGHRRVLYAGLKVQGDGFMLQGTSF